MLVVVDRVIRLRTVLCITAFAVLGTCFMMQRAHAQTDKDTWYVEETAYSNNKRLGERLIITFPNAPSEVTKTTTMVMFEEGYYNRDAGKYKKRMVAIITGMGLGTTGLKIVLDDYQQVHLIDQCFNNFEKIYSSFSENRDAIKEQSEDWMTDSWELIGKGRPTGDVFFYPSKKPLKTEFNWDFELNRVWLSMGNRIFVDQEVVPFLSHMMGKLSDYRDLFYKYRETIKSKNREIDTLLSVNSY